MYQTSADFVQQMDRRPFQVLLTGAQGSAAVDTLEYSAAWCPSAFTPVSYTHLDVYKRQDLVVPTDAAGI